MNVIDKIRHIIDILKISHYTFYAYFFILLKHTQQTFKFMMTKEKNKLDFTLLNIGYAKHDGDWNFKNIKSPFARIHYILEGEANIIFQNTCIKLKADHMYLTPAHVHHGYECSSTLSLFYIHIYENPERKSSIFDRYIFPKEIFADKFLLELVKRLHSINPGRELSIYDPKSYDNSSELMKNIALQINSPFALEAESQAIIQLLISRFLAGATSRIPDVDKRLSRVLDYIDDHLHQQISIDALADLTFLSKDHLIRLFKKQMDITPMKYINQKKIEKAQLMMLVDDINIQEISFKLGFENISYFNRLFKKMTGENPTSYKRRIGR